MKRGSGQESEYGDHDRQYDAQTHHSNAGGHQTSHWRTPHMRDWDRNAIWGLTYIHRQWPHPAMARYIRSAEPPTHSVAVEQYRTQPTQGMQESRGRAGETPQGDMERPGMVRGNGCFPYLLFLTSLSFNGGMCRETHMCIGGRGCVTAHGPQGPDAQDRSIRGLSMHGFLRLDGLS